MPSRARVAFIALLSAALVPSELASAQTISASSQVAPDRIVNGVDLGTSTRPANLTPLGINYNDCIQDITLRFDVLASGFTGAETVQVWATQSGDCTQPASRGVGSNSVINCWLVATGLAGGVIDGTRTETFDIRVQDLVGPQSKTLTTPSYFRQGAEACSAQPTFIGIPMALYFLPVDQSSNAVGTSYRYQIATDLVGPPAPSGVSAAPGDKLLSIDWTPNADSDTTGYDVFLDPPPGLGDVSANGSDASGGAPSCNNACASIVFSGGASQDGGAVVETDDAGNPIVGSTLRAGGLSTIPSEYIVGASASTGVTVSDENTGTYTITGLLGGPGYTAVVAGVDAFGNVGPPSAQVCGCPSVGNDMGSLSGTHSARAGGGCALEALGKPGPALSAIAFMIAGGAFLRRRRRFVATHSP